MQLSTPKPLIFQLSLGQALGLLTQMALNPMTGSSDRPGLSACTSRLRLAPAFSKRTRVQRFGRGAYGLAFGEDAKGAKGAKPGHGNDEPSYVRVAEHLGGAVWMV